MDREITRIKGDRYCAVTIKVSDEGRLTVTGESGRVVRTAVAKKEALEYWRSFFDDSPDEIRAMNEKCGTHFRGSLSAAKYVLRVDGDFHGLDVREGGPTGHVLIGESFGQIREEILEFFPEVAPLFPWHLNDMCAGCEHQEALGWGHGKTIALTADTLTEAQRETFEKVALDVAKLARAKLARERWDEITSSEASAGRYLRSIGLTPTIHDVGVLCSRALPMAYETKKARARLEKEIEREITPEVFDAAIFKDSLCAPCPTCGYRYGTAWLKRELPPEIIALAETVCADEGRAA
jgi:hypothetical protein